MGTVLAVAVGIALVALWALFIVRHNRRRSAQTADWDGSGAKPDLWTSSATCIHCGASGGFLELRGDAVEFECLSCGRRHARSTRG